MLSRLVIFSGSWFVPYLGERGIISLKPISVQKWEETWQVERTVEGKRPEPDCSEVPWVLDFTS